MTEKVILEMWEREGYWNRLVTNGRRIWLEYLPRFIQGIPEWTEDGTSPEFWLINFNEEK